MRKIINKLIILALKLAWWALVIVILLTLFGIAMPYISNLSQFDYLQPVIDFEISFNQMIKDHIPTRIAGYDLSKPMTIVAAMIIIDFVNSYIEKLKFFEQKAKLSNELTAIKAAYKSPAQKDKLALLESKMEQASMSTGKNRQELLKDFASIKKELEKIGRDLAFLAIDVADSTGMKVGEDPAIVEHDFLEYHNFIEAKFREHGLIKASWTPDGVMACFNTIEDAVETAKSILNGLEYFNRHVKGMKRDFVIRCGVNGGHVYYDDSIPLEQFSDRTIDIAGHMQKYAPPNSILIAKQMIEPVKSREKFLSTERIVDGLEVCEYTHDEPKTPE